MVESDRFSLLLPAQHVFGKDLVLLEENREIFPCQRAGTVGSCDDRFHRKLRKPQFISHMENVIGEIGIKMRVCAAHVIALLTSGIRELLEERNYSVIASLSPEVNPEPVVYLFSSVQTQDHVVALLIGPLDDFIGDAHAVCSQCEPEVLILLFFDASGVGDQLLADLEVHQRFSAKKVHFQVLSKARVLNQEIQRSFAGLKAHQPGGSLKFPLRSEAIFAVKVAGVRNKKAERFDDRVSLLHVISAVPVYIFRKQFAGLTQFCDIGENIRDIRLCDAPA